MNSAKKRGVWRLIRYRRLPNNRARRQIECNVFLGTMPGLHLPPPCRIALRRASRVRTPRTPLRGIGSRSRSLTSNRSMHKITGDVLRGFYRESGCNYGRATASGEICHVYREACSQMHFQKKLRIAYLGGPASADKVYLEWSEGRTPSSFDISYLRQFYEVCSELESEGHVITTVPGRHSCRRMGKFLIENRPTPSISIGAFYHLSMAYWFVRLLARLLRYRPDVLIVTAEQNYWFLLMPLHWIGVMIIPAIHCTLWPQFFPLRRSWQVLRFFNRIFFRKVKAAIAISNDVAEQVRSLTTGRRIEISVCSPLFLKSHFADVEPASQVSEPPFKIVFAGRIETNKGVYDLLKIAQKLDQNRKGEFRFDVCGDGPELKSLKEDIRRHGLDQVVFCHGFCDARKLRTIIEQSHVIIVPTTTRFEEGLAKVCAEAILAGRPVITSAVCPALAKIREAAIEVPPDNIDAYYEAILQLNDDRSQYEQKCKACGPLQDQFYDARNSYGAKLRSVLLRYGLASPG
jgi:glycogen(starch) synthase